MRNQLSTDGESNLADAGLDVRSRARILGRLILMALLSFPHEDKEEYGGHGRNQPDNNE
jgi:hypothetical protein